MRSPRDVLVATDCFTTEVWTWCGLVTYARLFCLPVGSQRVHIAGLTPHPNASWMAQIARNATMETWGFLQPGQYLMHDRDGKYGPAFRAIIDHAGVTRGQLPPRSPHLHAFAEWWVRSVQSEALSKLILCGERALRHALKQYTTHFHEERSHQGIGNVIPFPNGPPDNEHEGPIQCHERLGGLLKFSERKAA